jgi:hypothetical protein
MNRQDDGNQEKRIGWKGYSLLFQGILYVLKGFGCWFSFSQCFLLFFKRDLNNSFGLAFEHNWILLGIDCWLNISLFEDKLLCFVILLNLLLIVPWILLGNILLLRFCYRLCFLIIFLKCWGIRGMKDIFIFLIRILVYFLVKILFLI